MPVSVRNRESGRTAGRAARRSHLNLSGNGSHRNRGCNLRIGVHRVRNGFHASEGDLIGSREARARDGYDSPNRPARRCKAEDRRCNSELLVTLQSATGCNGGDQTSGCTGRNARGNVSIGHHVECGAGAVEFDAGSSGEATTQDAHCLGNFP